MGLIFVKISLFGNFGQIHENKSAQTIWKWLMKVNHIKMKKPAKVSGYIQFGYECNVN